MTPKTGWLQCKVRIVKRLYQFLLERPKVDRMRARRLISVRSLLSVSLRWPFIRSTEPSADTAEDNYRAPPVSRTSTVRQGQSPCKTSVFSCIPIDMQSSFFSYRTCTDLTCTSVISPRIFDQNWWSALFRRDTSFYHVSWNSH